MAKKYALVSVLVSLISLVTLIPWLHSAGAPVRAVNAQPQTAVKFAHTEIMAATAQGLTFSLFSPQAQVTTDGQLTVAGLENRTREAGAPDLPVFATYIALPPQAEAVVSIEGLQVTETAVSTLRPAPSFDVSLPEGSHDFLDPLAAAAVQEQLSQPVYRSDSAIYAQNALYPNTLYTLSEPMYYRDLRLVKLTLYPMRYNPASGLLTQVSQMQVSISFVGGDVSQGYAGNGRNDNALSSTILNYDQAQNWRHLPQNVLEATATALPVGQQTFKITIEEDGIYEITGADLQAAGMNIAGVDPATLEMLYRGEPVAFQLLDNGDADFDTTDKIRFYGWAFDGPRAEKQYLGSQNVYWLWANGSSTHVLTATNENGQGYPVVNAFPESITLETPEQYHYHTRTNLWPLFPNDPDAWYMDRIVKNNTSPLTRSYSITLPHPVLSGPNAQVLVEVTTYENLLNYIGRVSINDSPLFGEKTLPRYWNDNITTTIPITTLQHLANNVSYTSMTTAGTGAAREFVFLNRFTVDYTRQLVALNDQLQFNAPTAGSHEFQVTDFNSDQAVVWDISNRLAPVAVDMSGAVSGSSTFTYKIGLTHDDDAAIIATTTANLRQPASITTYTPPSLDPAGGAAWVAISHADFASAAAQLAAHRADPSYTGLSTYVVDIADVINQYGYGLAIPDAIRSYLTHAFVNWSVQPEFLTLFGDATFNPLNLSCLGGCDADFNPNEPIYLLTDLVFKDPYQGLIPSDHTFVTIIGNDLVPDIAVGRIAASTSIEAETAVAKIMQYEQNQADPATWGEHANITFVADDADDGGDFHAENLIVASQLPPIFNVEQLWIEGTATVTNTDELRMDLQASIQSGLSLLNYRGHGSPWAWAKNPQLITSDMTEDFMVGFWLNYDHPIIILSANCQDGYFTYAGVPGLGETYLKLADDPVLGSRGTAAHWSSTGLGTTFEHTALMQGFYEGLFELGYTAIGDAINYAKLQYFLGGYQQAELYSFTLQGDPAMQLFRPDLSLDASAAPGSVTRGETVTFTLEIQNQALYPAHPTLTSTLPDGLEFGGVFATASISETVNPETGLIVVDVVSSVPENGSVTVTITATVSGDAEAGPVLFDAVVDSPSLDLNLADNSDQVSVNIFVEIMEVYLPAILRN